MSGRARSLAALATALVLVLSGCGFRGAYSIDLPGGAYVGSHPYTLRIQFRDVLDLVPQSGVRVADVAVGRVSRIALGRGWTAEVTVVVNGDVQLPANAVATIQQSSLLGEKYVSLAPPSDEAPQGRLGDKALIPLDRTGRSIEVEELLGALSLVLNGGGLAQLQTINHELGVAMEGRESDLRSTLTQLDTFLGGLDQQRGQINRALDSVNALAGTLVGRTGTIEKALDTIGPGLQVLNEQHDLLVSMLTSLARLGDVGTRIISRSATDTVADLQDLQPILSQLAAAGPDLANSLDLLITYPFPATSLTALKYRADSRTGGTGLFTNMTATMNLDLRQLLCRYAVDPVTGALKVLPQPLPPSTCGQPGTPPAPSGSQTSTTTTGPALPQLPALPSVPALPSLPGGVAGAVVPPGAPAPTGTPGLPQVTTGSGP